jgi:GTP-binding protein
VLVADAQLTTLIDFKYRRSFRAERGEDGRGRDQYGRAGSSLELRVPPGTLIYDGEKGEFLCDLKSPRDRFIAAHGGQGGLGNIHFAKPWNQAPKEASPGQPGEQRVLRLELRLLADVGLVGFPNVGKSTLLAAVSRARPKIADYPFTTVVPNLAVVQLDRERSFVIADIPGLIKGASEGAGLGLRFLKHIERTRVLVHLLDASELSGPNRDPIADFETINRELARYAPSLIKKRQVVALNKADNTEIRAAYPVLRDQFAARGIPLHLISGATSEGVNDILNHVWTLLSSPPE